MGAVKERGLIFLAPMVRAILAGRKTVTRRLVKDDPVRVGQILWCRETWCAPDESDPRYVVYRADVMPDDAKVEARIARTLGAQAWRPSIFMPRWASRITLEVVDVRAERLHDIRTADVFAEGAIVNPDAYRAGRQPVSSFDGATYPNARTVWVRGWDAINGKRAPWASNPWVWRIEFRRI